MTALEKITRELEGARVEPAELNGRPAWRITLAGVDSRDGGTFEALVYKEAARVQIRHLDAYKEARYAIAVLQGHPPVAGRVTHGEKAAWRAIDHFKELSGFTLAVPTVPAPETAPNEGTCSICPRGEGKCARHGKRRMAP
jgi:hypothetical protein